MKNTYLILFIFVCFLGACKDKNTADDTTQNTEVSVDPNAAGDPNAPVITPTSPGAAQATTPPTPTAEPPQNAKGVWHYTCPKGCAGGSGAADPCAKCGTTLAHNAAYHDGQAAKPVINNTAGQTVQTPTQGAQPVEPPQNAKGVWHYTCAKGCAGGAGAQGACSKCGGQLAHNAAYHQ